MTSGNVSGAPISHNDEEAYAEIRGFVDAILTNNRDIRIRTDDSVMDFFMGEPMMIRRSRGYAPIPYMTSSDFNGEVLAIGGELKNTFCIAKNNIFYPSSYVGDLADYRTVKALKDSIKRMLDLLECKPEIIVCDKHPKYNSTMVAEELSEELGIKLEYVQHHYAHILSNMACNDFLEENIGVSFDGTGYGDDDTIWGGEILTCNLDGFTRETHIKPFFQMGGDSSSKEGVKIAVSIIFSLFEKEEAYECIEKLNLCEKKDLNLLYMMFDKKMNGVNSTSMGRLFDAVSAVLGIRNKSTFEGESAIYLEYAAEINAGRDDKFTCLMDIALMGMKKLRKDGKLEDLDVSDEINACTIVAPIQIRNEDGEIVTEDWLISFKNETHNHPTEIEPFGGAATCLGGAIRDPLSGRTYVYQAMRVTGAADPTKSLKETMPGKLPQRKIVRTAAEGYSSYGNQIGLATGLVNEVYHPNYVAKRMEIGAVIGAAPKNAVVQQDLQRHTHLNHLQLAVLRFRRVMLLQKENFRDFSEEKKLLLSLRNVMTSVQVVYP